MEDQEKPKTADDNQIVDVAPAPVAEADTASETSTDSNESISENNGAKTEPTNDSTPSALNDSQLPAPTAPAGHKSSGPIAAIVAAIVVALGLAAVTVYAYMKMQNESKPTSSQLEDSNKQTETPVSEDVDNATKDVDEAINATDQSGFDEAELSDESLGL